MHDLFGNPDAPAKVTALPKTPEQQLAQNFKRVLYFIGATENPLSEVNPASVRSFLGKVARWTKTCEACGVDLFFIVNIRTGKPIPFCSDATCHFENCQNAERFRRAKR